MDNVIAGVSDVVLPFDWTYTALRKLALINFEKDPDAYYVALEPQWLAQSHGETGHRIVAYRTDGFVDVYDDPKVDACDEASFAVTGKGLCERVVTEIRDMSMTQTETGLALSFAFMDKYGRQVKAKVTERTKRSTTGIDLLAPVGSSSEHPRYLPVFFLYGFDFVRKRGTDVEIRIGEKDMRLDPFPAPVPKDAQWRYYMRYSNDCQIIELLKAKAGDLRFRRPTHDGTVTEEKTLYRFNENRELLSVEAVHEPHSFRMSFPEGFPDVLNLDDQTLYEGIFRIDAEQGLGTIGGRFTVKRTGSRVDITLIPDGWQPVTDSIFTKMMFQKSSLFCSWPSTYQYSQKIDLEEESFDSSWERIGNSD
ncbi:hypothetical protein [Salisediminibacterium selenitireducens]|uniref:Uncharacterized protein n=1 Tax=Bacillus selenitireducens (strain ATCC 700615 / DSM 15326 / MLS10) TaxID=439292 RepID=D6XXP9_BACIE|nr:hypothetical protein [Salisediminibacterium selenitireducens]ADI00092.1 hypothetical protein Bsel_2592 [[Bacillus] selenitireducens MLS10]